MRVVRQNTIKNTIAALCKGPFFGPFGGLFRHRSWRYVNHFFFAFQCCFEVDAAIHRM
jgi:hypothetical protein